MAIEQETRQGRVWNIRFTNVDGEIRDVIQWMRFQTAAEVLAFARGGNLVDQSQPIDVFPAA